MDIRYSCSEIPKSVSDSLFLAGPTPRDENAESWRPEALHILKELGYNGTVYVPEYEDGPKGKDFSADNQIKWERLTMQSADLILFWVPRELEHMPAFTTNVEFGLYIDSGRVVFGYPEDAPKMNYLDWTAKEKRINVHHSLEDACKEVMERSAHSLRKNEEVFVPSNIWNHPAFTEWYSNQVDAGHKLKYAKPLWAFSPGGKLFSFALQVHVFIPEENRSKVNEFIFGRTPVVQTVLYEQGKSLYDTKIVLVKEFRSPGNTSKDCFVYELPGGSSNNLKKTAKQVAYDEIYEETGLEVNPEDLLEISHKQSVATLSIHKTTVFSCPLTGKNIQYLIDTKDEIRGIQEDSERTMVVLETVKDCINKNLVDYSTVGMIVEALSHKVH